MLRFCVCFVFLLLILDASAEYSYRSLFSCSFESDCGLTQDTTDDFDWMEGRGRIRDQNLNFAPSADHTFGDPERGVYMYTPSDEDKRGQSAKLIFDASPVTINSLVSVDFVSHMYDKQDFDGLGTLRVYVNDDLIWNKTGNQGPTWIRKIVNATCKSRSLQVTFEGILGRRHSDIGIDDILIGIYEETLPGLFSCSFESDCGLTQDKTDDFDWIEGRGRIRNRNLRFAPSADHTFGDEERGVYMYTPSNEDRMGQSAKLIFDASPVTINSLVTVDFVSHMYDNEETDGLGTLRVYVNDDLIWNKTGNQGPTWIRKIVNATCKSRSLQVTFEGILGRRHSDIGIDDISIGIYEETLPGPTAPCAPTAQVTPALDVTPRPTRLIPIGPTPTAQVTPELDVTPRSTGLIEIDKWKIVAFVSLALVGVMGICLCVAAVCIFRISRKQVRDAQSKGGCGSAVSAPVNVNVVPSEYLPLNATIDKAVTNQVGSNTQSEYEYPYPQPRTHKLSWNNNDRAGTADDDDAYDDVEVQAPH